jgi:NAD+ synthase
MQTAAISQHISQWMKDYAHTAKSHGFVLGISGGIDSAITSTLAAETGLAVLCVEMPIHQVADQVNRAQEHIDWLKANYPNVTSVDTDLTAIFDGFIDVVPSVEDSENRLRSLVNTRARLRMTTLYYFAQLHNYLVAGTGNKVEDFGIGFYTKYGDGGVDLSPIADLMKTEVFSLGKELGVCQSILDAPPTDGLWNDDRTDEDQIGATYPELEWAMTFEGDENSLTDRQQEVLAIYRSFHRANRHKMIPIPVCAIPEELK